MRRPGDVLRRTEILDHVWDYAYDGTSNVVDVYVRYLRKRLERSGPPTSSRPSVGSATDWPP